MIKCSCLNGLIENYRQKLFTHFESQKHQIDLKVVIKSHVQTKINRKKLQRFHAVAPERWSNERKEKKVACDYVTSRSRIFHPEWRKGSKIPKYWFKCRNLICYRAIFASRKWIQLGSNIHKLAHFYCANKRVFNRFVKVRNNETWTSFS